ncbi:serine/threonine protein kinase, AGC [Pleurotus pulmonarius]|nr:serine/threonine protein kinase, AGC [Pleurotus pulmonarius]KAF4604093.1 serine/threonine protein kinase, AGC [Pleurotus pulmonarius]KAF4608922.1 serine/threonine protein kinase, AGC [Pleurotus pulmonarius]
MNIPRSSSLPASAPTIRPQPQLAMTHTHIQDSQSLLTPPMSPDHTEKSASATAGRDSVDCDDDIIVDAEPRFMNCSQVANNAEFAPPPSEGASTVDEWQEFGEMSVDPQVPEPAGQPPLRCLDDEQVHLQRPGTLRLTDFEVKGTLGTGTFGRVLLVRHRAPQSNFYAMKVLRKSEIVRLRQVEHVNAERYILSRVHHPFVVDLFATFQDSLNIYMLLSYVPGGELFTLLRRAQRFTPDVTRFYLATIILALKYLHSFNIIYRDLKPENLLLDSRGYLRLTDFGFAKIVDDRTWTLCGTPEYLAPEIIQSDGHGKAADWWACGILCYEMLVGYPPFFDESPYGIYEKILAGVIHWPKWMDRLSKELIKDFLHPDRTKRLGNLIGGPQDVLDHPWFRGVDWDALERREITAPIIPVTSSAEDTRNFVHLPPPILEEMPGLQREETPPPLQQRFDPVAYQFLEF